MKRYESFGIRSRPMIIASPIANIGWNFCMRIATLNGIYPTAASAMVKKSVPITPESSDTTKSELFSIEVNFTDLYAFHANGKMIMKPIICSKKINVDEGSP